jgi:hypothetical protein
MQPLLRTLQDHDLGHLRILAEAWGFDPPSGPSIQAARTLVAAMLDPAALAEMLESLPQDAQQALRTLQTAGGRMPLADLSRRFGPLREIGAGRRDREKIWRHPASPLETLWYRGVLARAFADSPTGPCEFGFIPSDILVQLKPNSPTADAPLGRPAPEPALAITAEDYALDDAVTLLAALRRRPSRDLEPSDVWLRPFTRHLRRAESARLLVALLRDLGIVQGPPLRPQAREVHDLLELPGAAIRARLLHAWAESAAWNDLAHVPGLQVSGVRWPNDPLAARRLILRWLGDVPRGRWWDLDDFVAQIHERHPGFQRPGGEFNAWYLQEASTGEFLRGFEHWEAVEGRLLRFMVTGPLHWLGAVEVGIESQTRRVIAFRTTASFEVLTGGLPTKAEDEPQAAASLYPDGRARREGPSATRLPGGRPGARTRRTDTPIGLRPVRSRLPASRACAPGRSWRSSRPRVPPRCLSLSSERSSAPLLAAPKHGCSPCSSFKSRARGFSKSSAVAERQPGSWVRHLGATPSRCGPRTGRRCARRPPAWGS